MRGFDNYRYRDKAPVIDFLRTVVQVAAAAHVTSFRKMLSRISRGIGRKDANMLRGWFYGSTHCPRYDSVQAVSRWLLAEGLEVALPDNVVELAKHRRVKSKMRRAA